MAEQGTDEKGSRLSPEQRRAILERQINDFTAAGYHVVKVVDHVAILEKGSSSVEIFVDGHGQVCHA